MTVSDAMVEAVWRHNQGSALITEQYPFAEINDVWRRAIRAALEAALAVQPVPTNAEIEAVIKNLETVAKFSHGAFVVGDDAAELGFRKQADVARANLLRLIAAQRAVARREALESGLKAAQGAFGLLSECAFATEVSVTGDGETMHAYYVPLGIITAMSEAFGTDRWVPFLIEHGFVASEEEYAMLAKEAE